SHLSLHPHLPAPPSSPTRRSSDLETRLRADLPESIPERNRSQTDASDECLVADGFHRSANGNAFQSAAPQECLVADPRNAGRNRSEEHTSELQSRENLVCRLLLEK